MKEWRLRISSVGYHVLNDRPSSSGLTPDRHLLWIAAEEMYLQNN